MFLLLANTSFDKKYILTKPESVLFCCQAKAQIMRYFRIRYDLLTAKAIVATTVLEYGLKVRLMTL